MTSLAADRYIVISSDGHAGAEMLDYRDYLERRYLEEFDAWAKTYVNPYDDLRGETAYRNWDSATRERELEDDGVVAEVLFPNTIPPFFPSGKPVGAAADPGDLRAPLGGPSGAQSVVGRLLCGNPRTACRDGADLPQRH